MGTVIAVSSVVYNLAGKEEDRPNYLKSLIVRNILSGTKNSMGESIKNGYLYGPAMKLRSFYRWADNEDNYGEVGMPTGQIQSVGTIDPDLVTPYIDHDPELEIWGQNAFAGRADIRIWAEKWILENRPEDYGLAWTVDYDKTLEEMTIQFPTGDPVIVPVADFDYSAWYIYCYYMLVSDPIPGELIEGDPVEVEEWPSTEGWTFVSGTTDPVHRIYRKQEVTTSTGHTIVLTVEHMHLYDDGTTKSYSVDTQEFTVTYSDLKLFIYKVGTGIPALDALIVEGADFGKFFPFIPIRLENEFLSETYLPDAYAQTKKAYKKATGSKLSKLVGQLEENEDLENIDHTYVVFGVSLNVLENSCRKYLYKFFEQLQLSQLGGEAAYEAWLASIATEEDKALTWENWKDNPEFDEEGNPVEPARAGFAKPKVNRIQMKGTGPINSQYDMTLEWNYMGNGEGTGLAKPEAKPDDLWFEFIGAALVPNMVWDPVRDDYVNDPIEIERCRLYWQRDSDTHTYIEIVGLVHENLVYGWESVRITAREALEDVEESGFIVPLHYDTWKAMSLIDTSQMATACIFLVFNCYEVHKTKWYESGIFRIILVIIIAIISVVFTGGAGVGLLGAHFSVGSALGFSGITAAIVGSVVNALAALILTTVLEKVTQALGFLGPLIGFLLMFVIGSVASSGLGNLSINWGDLLRVDNLLKLTDALGRGVTNMFNADTMGIMQDMEDFGEKAKREADKIQQAYFAEFGYGAGIIDPMMFVDSTKPVVESSDTFLTRTLMTGSEIADMSLDLLSGFSEYSLKLPDAFT